MSSKRRTPTLKVLFLTSELAPFSRATSLADLASALPSALRRAGVDLRVVTPLYGCIDRKRHGLVCSRQNLDVPLGGRGLRAAVWEGWTKASEVPVYFIDSPSYFDRAGLYQEQGVDYGDNLDRFAFFSRAALELCRAVDFVPDVVHAVDWPSALAPVYLRTVLKSEPGFGGIRTLLTLRDLEAQGIFPAEQLPHAGVGWDLFTLDGLEYYGKVNLLKGGINFADRITTLSPTYAREIQTLEHGLGLDGVLKSRESVLLGLPAGIDEVEWDPESDAAIAKPFAAKSLDGKAVCKSTVQIECGLPEVDVPLLCFAGTLDEMSGADILCEVLPELMRLDLQLVVLGTGKPAMETRLGKLARKHADKLALHLSQDQALLHRLVAGADMSLIPARVDAWGAMTMVSLRYGTVPIARRSGGLADAIVDYMPSAALAKTATGFHLEHASGADLMKSLLLALAIFRNKKEWRQLVAAGMKADVSWKAAAPSYVALYQELSTPAACSSAGAVPP
jgi:starch synthase